jgi:hypothetical protein
MRASSTTILVGACIVLTLMGGWRWHRWESVRPGRVAAGPGGAAVLLLRDDDCPDRRRGMMDWIQAAGWEEGTGGPLPLVVGTLRGGGERLHPGLAGLPRLDRRGAREAQRAALRAGIQGTPALLLVDPSGRVLLAEGFTDAGPGPGLGLIARTVPELARGLPSTGTTPQGPR